jgi:hypothetical protein
MTPIMGATMILVSCLVAYSGLVTEASPRDNLDGFRSQKPLSVPALGSQSFNVGFSLQSSYGYVASECKGYKLSHIYRAVAVKFENGTTRAFKVYGDGSYREAMSRLSLDSSRHLA